VFLPRIPEWIARLMLGEMSVVITTGSRVSCDRLIASGFEFRYPDIRSALKAC
jgi:NAD dependent epimerase/dehydratase family enzyme